jgi:hypothetical protein
MRQRALAVFLAALIISVSAAAFSDNPADRKKITVGELLQTLSASQGKTDTELALQLSSFALVERLSTLRLSRLNAALPGEKSREALLLLADQSAFLDPPDDEISLQPAPDPAATRQMLIQVVNYVNTTLRQLPNFIATREIQGFEDRPQEDTIQSTGTVSLSYQPLHSVGMSTATVTYSGRKEVVGEPEKKTATKGQHVGGLVTTGEFGPILTTVVADALKGKIIWARWEQGAAATTAVFHYTVPEDRSHYRVKFCCIANGFHSNGQPELQIFDEQAGYHGEIVFNPQDGSILRMTVEAEMPPQGLVPKAGIATEYGSVEIGGRNYLCPVRSISLLMAHTTPAQGMISRTNYKGQPKTFLNNVTFGNYRRFGSESHILTGEAEAPKQ